MSGKRQDAGWRSRIPLRWSPLPPREAMRPTWRDASPRRIREALANAHTRDAGGWYVVARSAELRGRSLARTIAGREVAVYRDGPVLRAGPGACPHLGALLDGCEVLGGEVACRWHGLRLGSGSFGWRPYPTWDDGLLVWVRLDTPGEVSSERPRVAQRPHLATSLSAVYVHEADCEPDDVIANRLDPWHGAWFHPYAFSDLTVDPASTPDRLIVDVTFRLGRRIGVPVRAEFTTPDTRTIVMTITEGEGVGSVVETHATPLGVGPDGRAKTLIHEAIVATSPRRGFTVARRAAVLLRPAMVATAGRLWVDDLAYAERLYHLRQTGASQGEESPS